MKRAIISLLIAAMLFALMPMALAAQTELLSSAEQTQSGAAMHIALIPETAQEPLVGQELIQLDAPTDLSWGKAYHYWDSGEERYDLMPGIMSWLPGALTQDRFEQTVYRVLADGTSEEIFYTTWTVWAESGRHCSVETGQDVISNLGSGTYYFTIRALGDGVQYADSPIATSPLWTYTAPDTWLPQMGKPTTWLGNEWIAQHPDYQNSALSVCVEVYYKPNQAAEMQYAGSRWSSNWVSDSENLPPEELTFFDEEITSYYGSGYYAYRVCAYSKDITAIRNSEWSELSDWRYVSAVINPLYRIFETLADRSPEELERAITEIKALETDDLALSMAADNENRYAVSQIQALEELTGRTATIAVDEDAPAALTAEGAISVIGAALNAEQGQSVSLQIGRANSEKTLPTMYENTVQFSMNLVDAETLKPIAPADTNLPVPVKIMLPIPETINPDFLVVLHHRSDGSYETVHPHTYNDGSGWYASFVVRHFSDFTLAEQVLTLGDVNADGDVTGKDVTMLRRYLAGGYGVAVDAAIADVNRDAAVTGKDVTMLRRYLAGGYGVELN